MNNLKDRKDSLSILAIDVNLLIYFCCLFVCNDITSVNNLRASVICLRRRGEKTNSTMLGGSHFSALSPTIDHFIIVLTQSMLEQSKLHLTLLHVTADHQRRRDQYLYPRR